MSLTPGTRLGPYEITALIGEGGMGKVWRAHHTALKRDDALKVLPDAFASDPDRLARFRREAQVLASLNHPNIAHVYGLEQADGIQALVMELVEGPTLADRIAQGLVPIDEALPIAKQIAEALEAAHEQGIIHRDLKPANVKVRPDGTVKVLDFGLAKAWEPTGVMSHGLSQSPTITTPAMTQAGVILGTAAYMSPEQARGNPVDKRADIWAFGALLYEMLTGRRAFGGDEVSEVLASVLAREPDWTILPAAFSPVLVNYLKRCLHKDRKQRIRDIGDVSLALAGAFETARQDAPPRAVAHPVWRQALPVAMTALVAVLVTGLVAWGFWPRAAPRSATRFDYALPVGQQFQPSQRSIVAISPDSRYFVYQTREGLYLRSMGDLEGRHIPGTEEALASPFVSPDGQWVGYWAATGQLKKVAVSGGTSVILCDATTPFGISWAPDNTILFGQVDGIKRVSANGGTPELVIRADDGEQMYGPVLLPDGVSVLFSVTRDMGPARWDRAEVVVQSLSSGKRAVVVQGGSNAYYLPTGHLVYALRDGVFGVAFDASSLTVAGGAVSLVQGVQRPIGVNAAASNYAVSDQGTLLYLTASASRRSLVWISREGTVEPIKSIPAGPYEEPRLSPDGGRVLVTRDGDIWAYDVASGRSSRLTRDGVSELGVWDPTSAHVAYSSATSGNTEVWVTASDGSGQPRRLTDLGGQAHVDSWSPDGRTLSLHHHGKGANNILMLRMDGEQKPQVLLEGAVGARFSHDGHYVAYDSAQTGQWEVYIRSYPERSSQMTVSVGGGTEPVWAQNGDIFYRNLTRERMFVVPVTTAPELKVGTPVQLFQGSYYVSPSGSPTPQYDVSADGQRLLMLTDAAATPPRIVVVQNWTEEIKRLVPTN